MKKGLFCQREINAIGFIKHFGKYPEKKRISASAEECKPTNVKKLIVLMKDVLIQIKNAHKDRGGGIKQTLQEKKFGRTQKSHPSNLEFFTTPQKRSRTPFPGYSRFKCFYQMKAVVDFERLADGTLLGAGAHGARRDPVGLPGLDVDAANGTADPLLPVVDVDAGQGVAGYPGVQERVRDVEHRTLNGRHLKCQKELLLTLSQSVEKLSFHSTKPWEWILFLNIHPPICRISA